MLLMISMVKKLLEHFMKRNCKKQVNRNIRLKKSIKQKETKYMSNGKDMIIHLISGLIKKNLIERLICLIMQQRGGRDKFPKFLFTEQIK